ANLRRGPGGAPATTTGTSSGLGTRLVAAMPERATGHLNRLLVAAGRPGGWTVDKLVTAKLALGLMGVALALLLIVRTSGVGPVLLAMALPVLLFLLPDL